MKKPIFRTITALVGAGLTCYTGFLYSQGASVGTSEQLTTAGFVVAGLVGIYMILLIIASRKFLPTNRYTIALVGIGAILFANLYLVDDPTSQVYLADILKLVGVYLAIIGPMKLLVTKRIEEETFDKKVEVIEV